MDQDTKDLLSSLQTQIDRVYLEARQMGEEEFDQQFEDMLHATYRACCIEDVCDSMPTGLLKLCTQLGAWHYLIHLLRLEDWRERGNPWDD